MDGTPGETERTDRSAGRARQAIAAAKQRAKIPADSGVEIVVYPPRKSFYEILTDEFSGSSDSQMAALVTANLSSTELQVLRTIRGPFGWFRRGEPLALMPFSYLR